MCDLQNCAFYAKGSIAIILWCASICQASVFFCNGVFVRFRPLIAPRDWICWSELFQFSFFDCLNRWRWFLSKTDSYNSLFFGVSPCCSFSNVCTTELEFVGILLAPLRQLSSIFLRVVTFPELSRGRGRSQNKSRLKHQNHIYFWKICPINNLII